MNIKSYHVHIFIKSGHIHTNSKPIKHFKYGKRDFLHINHVYSVINLGCSIG